MIGTAPHDASGPGWTDERVALLTKLWGEGLSAKDIAEQLGGVTKNAVLGRIHRMGLSGRKKEPKPVPKPAPAPKREKPAPRQRADVPLPPDTRPLRVVDLPCTVPLLDLTSRMCRYPAGDGADIRFCGLPKARGSFCSAHAHLVYVPAGPEIKERRAKRPAWGRFFSAVAVAAE